MKRQNQDTQVTFSMAQIMPNEEIDSDEEPPEKRVKVYETCGLQSRNEESNALGKPDDRKGCFGCVYVGERESAAIQYDDIFALVSMISKTIARTDPINLSLHVAAKYKAIRDDVNSSLLENEQPLPKWTAASVLDHIRHHNTDPEIQLWLRLCEMQELIQIALQACVEQDPETGQKRTIPSQVKIYMDLIKAYETLSKSDPAKKVFHKPNAHIDMDTGSQGLIAVSGKNIFNYSK